MEGDIVNIDVTVYLNVRMACLLWVSSIQSILLPRTSCCFIM